jgi:signal transduction histidine kinase
MAAMLDEASETIRQAIHSTRDLVFDLSSPLLNEIGLEAAVAEWLEEKVAKRYGLETEFIGAGQPLSLDDDVRAMLFRSVRELLANVIRHAQADKVSVRVERSWAGLGIVVQDDGVGFDPEASARMAEGKTGFGLFSMRERMSDLGGALEIVSEPGAGCMVILTVPSSTD